MKLTLTAVAAFLTMSMFAQQTQQAAPTGSLQVRNQSISNTTTQSFPAPGKVVTPTFTSTSAGNHVCTSHELNEKHYQERGVLNEYNQSYTNAVNSVSPANIVKTPGVNEISVIFHVVYNPSTPGSNVSNALIMDVYNDIVEDYQLLNANAANARGAFGFVPADANINFCLATQDPTGSPLAEPGVIRVSTTEDWYDSDNGEENKMKASATGGSQIWNRNNYLNVWICDITNGAGSGTAGYAYRPTTGFLPGSGIDGIVIDYNLGVNNENILTHEIGHYLGLDHTWGGSGSCASDDGFADTPNTEGPSFNYAGSCSGSQSVCGTTETMYENYMDYSNCTVMFTQDQADFMLVILQGIRGSLLSSPGCDPTNTPPNSAFNSIPAGPGPVVIPVNGGVNFIDQSTNAPTGWAWTISGTEGVDWSWINATTAASQDPQAEFYTVGFYDVTLTASNSFGVDATPASEVSYVQVVAPASGTACDTLRNYDPVTENPSAYLLSGFGAPWTDWGVMVGHGGYDETGGGAPFDITHYADRYTAAASAELRQLQFIVYQADDLSGTGLMKINVHSDDAGGVPGTVLVTDTLLIADMIASSWNTFDFSSPATVTGNFWVSLEFEYGATQDTVVIGMVDMTERAAGSNVNTLYQQENGTWNEISTNYGATWVSSLYMDVLLSNGPDPSATFTATEDSVCVGGDILVNGSASTNVTDYSWFVTDDPFTTIITQSAVPTNTFNFPTAGNFTVYLFGDGSCKTSTVIMPVVVNDPVSATFTGTATTCGGNNGVINVTAPTGGDGTYYYSLDGITFQTSNMFDSLPAGDYDVTIATLGDLCETTVTVTVGTSVEFVAGVSANSSICPGGSATITASGGTGYLWYDGATLISSVASATVTPAATTQYSCLVTDGAGCQSTVYTTVTITAPPSAPIITASGPLTFCQGGSVDLTSSEASGNLWSTTSTSNVVTVTTSGDYTVSFTDGNGCVSALSTITAVTVDPLPVISIGTVNNPTVCASLTGDIEVAGTGTGIVSWTGTSTGSSASVTLPYVISGLSAGSYNISFVDASTCSSNIVNQALSDPTPPATPTITASGSLTFCQGGSVDLTASDLTGNSWSTLETTQTITVNSTGVYSVTYTDGSGCSAASTPISVTVNALPTTPTITAGGALSFCSGGSVDLTSSQGTGNLWSTLETTQTINVIAAGDYTVDYTDVNGCSATSSITTVTINSGPTVDAGLDVVICEGETAILSGSGALTYGWDNGVIDATGFIPSAGMITYTVTGADVNGCLGMDQVDVTVNALPAVDAGLDQSVCSGNMVTLNGAGATTYAWDNGVLDGVAFAANAVTTTYTVTGTDANGCVNTDQMDVISGGSLTVDAGIDQAICEGGTVTLSGSGAVTYTWDNGVVDGAGFMPTSTITYTVTGVDGAGCSGTDMVEVVVNSAPTVALGSLGTVCVYDSPVTLTGGTPAGGTYSGTSVTGTSFDPSVGVSAYNITYSYTDANGCSNSAVAAIVVDGCAGIEEISSDEVLVYPNPTAGIINVKANSVISQVRIFDAAGRLVKDINGNNQEEIKIEMINLSSGLYNVEVVNASSVFRTQVFKN